MDLTMVLRKNLLVNSVMVVRSQFDELPYGCQVQLRGGGS